MVTKLKLKLKLQVKQQRHNQIKILFKSPGTISRGFLFTEFFCWSLTMFNSVFTLQLLPLFLKQIHLHELFSNYCRNYEMGNLGRTI